MSCSLLTQINALPVSTIVLKALGLLNDAELQLFCEEQQGATVAIMQSRLAELIYYRHGHGLALHEQWNEMTRLQLEHELCVRGLLDANHELTDWQLRLKLRCVFLSDRLEAKQKLAGEHMLEEKDSGYGSGRDADDESDAPGDDDRKLVYVKQNGRTMVY